MTAIQLHSLHGILEGWLQQRVMTGFDGNLQLAGGMRAWRAAIDCCGCSSQLISSFWNAAIASLGSTNISREHCASAKWTFTSFSRTTPSCCLQVMWQSNLLRILHMKATASFVWWLNCMQWRKYFSVLKCRHWLLMILNAALLYFYHQTLFSAFALKTAFRCAAS